MRKKSRRRRKATQKKWIKRKKSINLTQNETMLPKYKIFQNPNYGMSINQRWSKIQKIAKTNEETYQNTLSELRSELVRYNPQHVLSYFTYRRLGIIIHPTEGVTKLDNYNEIFPFHIESLQALLLQIAPEKMSRKPCPPDKLYKIWNLIQTLVNTQVYRHFNPNILQLSEEEKAVALVQYRMSCSTMTAQNWGHHLHVKRLARELYCHFDEKLLGKRKFSVSDIISVFETMYFEICSKQSDHIDVLKNLFKSSGNDACKLIQNYFDLVGSNKEEAEQFINKYNVQHSSLIQVIPVIDGHYQLHLPEVYTFRATDLAKSLNLSEDIVKAVLDEYALSIGELSEYKTEDLHISNPVWEKPVIKLPAGEYFYALPAGFFSFMIPCLEAVLSPFKLEVSERRAKFLESKVAEIVKKRLPNSQIETNFKCVIDGKQYEADLIAFVDSFALLIECKSEKITKPPLKGEPNRLRNYIRKLLIDPNEQSSRLKEHLEFLSSNADVADPIRDQIGYDLGKVHRFIRVSVSLEDFGQIQSSLKQLNNTDWLPPNFVPYPSMNLASFETIFDILEDQYQIIDYFMKRESIEESISYNADEIDLLSLYLTTLLNIAKVKPGYDCDFSGLSSPLNIYYNSLNEGVTLKKPRAKISPLFSSIFSQLATGDQEGLTKIGIVLFKFSPDEQINFMKELDELKKKLKKNRNTRGQNNTLLSLPSNSSTYGMVCVLIKDDNTFDLMELMEKAATKALKISQAQTLVVIGKNIDHDSIAFHFIGLHGEQIFS